MLPTGEVSTLTDIQEYVSNEGNTQVETLSENVNEAIDTDQRQTLLGINQGKDLERLTSDVMNQSLNKRPCRIAGTCQTGQHIEMYQ